MTFNNESSLDSLINELNDFFETNNETTPRFIIMPQYHEDKIYREIQNFIFNKPNYNDYITNEVRFREKTEYTPTMVCGIPIMIDDTYTKITCTDIY
jgi:hypothetical protein